MDLRRDIIVGDCLELLANISNESIDCCVTSPPYFGLRDYGVNGQVGLETSPEDYISHLVVIFREVRRVLKSTGTLWLVLGDSYAGSAQKHKTGSGLAPKQLFGIPWRVALALQADGWYLRQDIIWHKPNPMPESVTDRCTKSHEYIFLLSKSGKYFFDGAAIREPCSVDMQRRAAAGHTRGSGGRVDKSRCDANTLRGEHAKKIDVSDGKNKRSVWSVNIQGFKDAHFATFPTALITPCILAGCPLHGVVLDPFFGAGTTGLVACQLQRGFVGIELNPDYALMARARISAISGSKFAHAANVTLRSA